MVTLSLPVLKSKRKYCMAGKPSHVSRVSLSHIVEIGLSYGPDGPDWDVQGTILNVA
jgi:hypothetical protein